MTLKSKTIIGIYIITILALSGASKAEALTPLFGGPNTEIAFADVVGVVFESNGYLYFESEGHETLLVHSSNFDFFKNMRLPVDVKASSILVSYENDFSASPKTVRFMTNTITRGNLL